MAVSFINKTPLIVDEMVKQIKHEPWFESRHQVLTYFLMKRNAAGAVAALAENRFITAGRPFFNVYPAILDALVKTPLSIVPSTIPKSVVHDLPAISIRLPQGGDVAKAIKTEWMILSVFDGKAFNNLNATTLNKKLFNCERPFLLIYYWSHAGNRITSSALTLDHSFEDINKEHSIESSRMDIINLYCKIALGVMMLAADKDYIKPITLACDKGKNTPLQQKIDKAKRRGVYGFTIGKEMESTPHIRRPHFAIRWTGKNASTPKLVPVKAAIVGGKKATEVPTGFESPRDKMQHD